MVAIAEDKYCTSALHQLCFSHCREGANEIKRLSELGKGADWHMR